MPLPDHLPATPQVLIEELDRREPKAEITALPVGPAELQKLIFQAGRRSIVDELILIQKRAIQR